MVREKNVVTPSLTKHACSDKATIELRRNRDGDLFFATRNGTGFATWHVYPTGEGWLRDHGYVEGDLISLSVAMHLHRGGMSYTGGQGNRTSQRQTGSTPAPPQPFDWSQSIRVEQRLGTIRSETTTINRHGPQSRPSDRETFLSNRRPRLAPSPNRPSRGPRSHQIDKDLADLIESTRQFDENRKRHVLETSPGEPRPTSARHTSGDASRRANTTAHQAGKTSARNPSPSSDGPRSTDHTRIQTMNGAAARTGREEELVSIVMERVATASAKEPVAVEAPPAFTGIPRRHIKKALKRKRR